MPLQGFPVIMTAGGRISTPSTGFVVDNFDGVNDTPLTSHTPNVGGAWIKAANFTSNTPPVIDNANRLRPQDNGTAVLYNAATPPSADYYVQADFSVVTNIGSGSWYVVGRYDQSANTGYFVEWNQDEATITLRKGQPAVSETILGSSFSASVSDGASYTVKLQMIGTTIKMFVNGSEITSVTDGDYSAANNVALSVRGTSTNANGFRIDNFLAQST